MLLWSQFCIWSMGWSAQNSILNVFGRLHVFHDKKKITKTGKRQKKKKFITILQKFWIFILLLPLSTRYIFVHAFKMQFNVSYKRNAIYLLPVLTSYCVASKDLYKVPYTVFVETHFFLIQYYNLDSGRPSIAAFAYRYFINCDIFAID